MPTYTVKSTSGQVIASGVPSWPAACRLADAYTAHDRVLYVVSAESREVR